MKKIIFILLLCCLLGLSLTACGNDNSDAEADSKNDNATETESGDEQKSKESQSEEDIALPAETPADFPFPEGDYLEVQTMEMAGGMSYIVGFTFSGDIDTVYEDFKEYATNNGYTASFEDKENYQLTSTKGTESIAVKMSDAGSVTTATVTFIIPSE
ncbi:hypothetical protein [Virgibacillus doumboii]|uniref:hypothetical protein n=1 Tax=Virgibacillus doumboii TaxID=2697503 RepID=UPI0013DEE3F2|nr:hypothetical protein [Virgibacillus doumboii]